MVKIIFSKTYFFSKIFQSAWNSRKVLPRTFKNNHKEIYTAEFSIVKVLSLVYPVYVIDFFICLGFILFSLSNISLSRVVSLPRFQQHDLNDV